MFLQVIAKTALGTARRSDSWNFAPYPSLKHGAAGPAETPETLAETKTNAETKKHLQTHHT